MSHAPISACTCLSCKGYPNSLPMAAQNFKVTMEMDGLQKRITELCDINADLQVSWVPVIFIIQGAALWNSSLPLSLLTQCPLILSFLSFFFSCSSFLRKWPPICRLALGANRDPVLMYCRTLFLALCNFSFFFHRCRFTRLMPLLMKRELRYKRSVLYSHFSWFCPYFKVSYYKVNTERQIIPLICC